MIYGLYNKNTGYVRYVGRTKQDLKDRLGDHKYRAKHKIGNAPKDEWMREVGVECIEIMRLEKTEDDVNAELWWMDYMEFLGFDLLNVWRCDIGSKKLDLPDECVEKFGTVPDCELAEKYGVSTLTIWKKRNKAGVDPFTTKVDVPKECIEQLGEKPDTKLAEEFGITPSVVRKRREDRNIKPSREINLPDECIKKMGKVSDKALAREYNVSPQTIGRRRKKKGISPFSQKIKLPEECYKKMGEKPDTVLAEKYDVAKTTIAKKRRKRGIQAFNK